MAMTTQNQGQMNTLKRYTTAFVKALKLTLAGNPIQPPEVRYPRLAA